MPAGSSPLLDDDFMRRVLQQYSVQQYLAPQQQAGAAAAAAAAGGQPALPQPAGASGGGDDAAPLLLVSPHFPLKHLNIVDPLLPSNNLGRSVSKASYARVRKALALGSRTLEAALLKVGATWWGGGWGCGGGGGGLGGGLKKGRSWRVALPSACTDKPSRFLLLPLHCWCLCLPFLGVSRARARFNVLR